MNKMTVIISLIIMIFLFVHGINAIDINDIIKSAQQQHENQEKYLGNYSYNIHLTAKATKKSGEILWEESGEQTVYLKPNERYTEILKWIKNGKPLSWKELKKKEERLNEDLKEGKNEAAHWPFKRGAEKYYEYQFVGEEKVNEYYTYKINVVPKMNQNINLCEGDFWVDKLTHGLVKAIYAHTRLPKLHKKMEIEVHNEQIKPAIWLPSYKLVKSEVTAIVYIVNSEVKTKCDNYKIN